MLNTAALPGTFLDQTVGGTALPSVRAAWVLDVMAQRLDDDLECELTVTAAAVVGEVSG